MLFELVQTKADGLYLATSAPLQQLVADELLGDFADGLLPRVVAATLPAGGQTIDLAELLFSPNPDFGGLLAGLLALDAEVIATINGDRRVWPLSGFLSYRARLLAYQPEAVRLPPHNPGGRYLVTGNREQVLVLRFELHPSLRVLGHVRIAIASEKTQPERLTALEHRLERRTLTCPMLEDIKIAGSAGDLVVDPTILKQLISLLQEFAGANG